MLLDRRLDAGRPADIHVPSAGQGQKPRRADHKFQRKAPARKARASRAVHGREGTDGSALSMGRRGGLVRVSSGA